MRNKRFDIDNRKTSKRENCPECKGRRTFTRYYDTMTGEQLPEEYGICTRLNKCGHHLSPWNDGFAKNILRAENEERVTKESSKVFLERVRTKYKPQIPNRQFLTGATPEQAASSVPNQMFTDSLQGLGTSNFNKYLVKIFGAKKAAEIVANYYLGAKPGFRFKNRDFPGYASPEGSCIFWRISYEGKVHSGKVMLYDSETGKRIKKPFDHVNWVHTLHKLATGEPMKNFFGVHLLKKRAGKPIMIHESEKTACIASGYLPEYVHLACGGLAMLTPERCEVLKGRQVVLCPDLDGFEKWAAKAKELGFGLFTGHKQKADQAGLQGLKFDLADFLVNIPFPGTQESEPITEEPVPETEEPLPEFISEYKTEEGFTLAKLRFPNNELKKVLFDPGGHPMNLKEYPEELKRLFVLFGSGFEPGFICGFPCLVAPCGEKEEPGLSWEPIISGLKALPRFRHQLTYCNGNRIQEPTRRIREIEHSVRYGSQSVELFEEAAFILRSAQANPYLVTAHRKR